MTDRPRNFFDALHEKQQASLNSESSSKQENDRENPVYRCSCGVYFVQSAAEPLSDPETGWTGMACPRCHEEDYEKVGVDELPGGAEAIGGIWEAAIGPDREDE
jgi:hypothetical protein